MATALLTHSAAFSHVTPEGHPERVARIRAVTERLAGPEFGALRRAEAPLATGADLARCHPPGHIDRVRAAVPQEGIAPLDGDTFVSPGSWEAALRAVGGNLRAVDMVLGGEVSSAFVAMRPPGHHAEAETAMGFCLFGNVALAARHALDVHGLSRVAIVDFDVHHGNGTQALLWHEERAFFASTHQMPLFPGTGARAERGAHGNILNRPLAPGDGSRAFRAAMEEEVLPAVERFAPELVLISAGFDAHAADPIGGLELATGDFARVTRSLVELAGRACGGRVVSTLEGGYDLDALADGVAAHVTALMEHAE